MSPIFLDTFSFEHARINKDNILVRICLEVNQRLADLINIDFPLLGKPSELQIRV